MLYILSLLSILLCCLFDPLYDNYTSLLSSPYHRLYIIWIFLLASCLLKNIIRHCLSWNEKRFIVLLYLLFIVGSYLPYYSAVYLFSLLHVILPMSTIIGYLLYILYVIFRYSKKEPLQAQILYQWFLYGISLISLLIIYFAHINGIIEVSLILLVIFLLKKLKIIDYS